jgi:hypothetical protein
LRDITYDIEVTYNYGKYQYQPDDSIQFFGIVVEDVDATIQKAVELGYSTNADQVILGPDEYAYKPLKKPEGATKSYFSFSRTPGAVCWS